MHNMNLQLIKKKLKNKIWMNIRGLFYENYIKEINLIQNINYQCDSNQPRMLICYLTIGFISNLDDPIGRTQPYEIFKIIDVFAKLNYCIDIIGNNEVKGVEFIKSKKYDLIFGLGNTFYIMTQLQPEAKSILYMTEHHPTFSYVEEKKRIDYYRKRHKKKVNYLRSLMHYNENQLKPVYDAVITMSEVEPLLTQYKSPYTIFPTGLINKDFNYSKKNHLIARKNFLWIGSSGAIHKGLDLLIDVFAERNDIMLHVCGLNAKEKKFLNIKGTENIKEYGQININSDLFLKIVGLCTYIILPSCSEGFSTSITTGMLHGLIPVVMKDTGFNRLGGNVILLDDYHIEYLNDKITELSNADTVDLEMLSKQIYTFARNNFTLPVFESNFKNIIDNILSKNND